MLLPGCQANHAVSCLGALILFAQEQPMPNGYFGDRDAGHRAQARPCPPASGLFGRLGGDPPLRPANESPADLPIPDRPVPRR